MTSRTTSTKRSRPSTEGGPDIALLLRQVRREIKKFTVPAVTQVAWERDPFLVLVSTLISLRTKDDVTASASARLFKMGKTPKDIAALKEEAIAQLIYPAGFYRTKAKTIRDVCRTLLNEHEGQVPSEIDELVRLKGVGRKTANLVVTLGFNKPGICVDIHVHRISNRWGYVSTKDPEKTEWALREKMPRRYWISYNDLLVTFGQNVCLPVSPKCSSCPLEPQCPKLGVTRHR